MAIITITSDWGSQDHYVAAVKGRLLSLVPDATIVDISHNIDRFNHDHAAFVVRHAFPSFPAGTIHIICVNSIAGKNTPHTVIKYHDHYFIGADNGILSLICGDEAQEIREIDIASETDYFTFPGRDTFPKVAAMIISGTPLSKIGTPRHELTKMMQFEPIVTDNQIRGKVIYVDNYLSAITNIPEPTLLAFVKGRRFNISFRQNTSGLNTISKSYDDVPEGEIVALFSTTGYLEIAVNRGKINELCGLKYNEPVMITREPL